MKLVATWLPMVESSIGSNYGFAQNRRQVIFLDNDWLFYWRIYAQPSLNEITDI